MGNRTIAALLLVLIVLAAVSAAPLDNLKIVSNVDSIVESDLIGDSIDSLLAQLYNNIIKSRLQTLLQGVGGGKSKSTAADYGGLVGEIGLEAAGVQGSSSPALAEVFLPPPVTPIPLSLLTSLPGID